MFDPITGSPERRLILRAVRSCRDARDAGLPILPAVYAALETDRCGILAPVITSLLTLFESGTGRRLRADAPEAVLQDDEDRLLAMLQAPDAGAPDDAADAAPIVSPAQASTLRSALRSTRIMVAMALESVGAGRPRLRFVGVG